MRRSNHQVQVELAAENLMGISARIHGIELIGAAPLSTVVWFSCPLSIVMVDCSLRINYSGLLCYRSSFEESRCLSIRPPIPSTLLAGLSMAFHGCLLQE